MRKAWSNCLLGLALTGPLLVTPAWAQRGRGRVGVHAPLGGRPVPEHEAPLETFQHMTPEERERALASLPVERRQKLQKQLKHYDQLTPAQRSQLDWFNRLPSDRQDAIRKAYKKFVNEPPERQQSMRDEMTRLTTMPAAERQTRFSSPEFRSRFKKNEQQILEEMSATLPRD